MRSLSWRLLAPCAFAVSVAGAACNGTTGDQLFSFAPYASGVAGAGEPFVVGGYSIKLVSASMYVGAVYFDESPTSTSFDAPSCNTSDVFAAQVAGGVKVDLLSVEPQEFGVYGNGSADIALSWDLWLSDGDINQPTLTPTATVTGTATLLADPSKVYSFGAIVTINPGESGAGARGTPVSNAALPGASPICKQRILQIGGVDLAFSPGGSLLVQIDPRGWFAAAGAIDFSSLQSSSTSVCQLDASSNATYESHGPCSAASTCPSGLVCDPDAATPVCVEPCGPAPDDTCSDGFVCNPADGRCMAALCIPDSSWAGCPESDPKCGTTQAAASAGQSFFLGVLGGGSAAYSVHYSQGMSP